METFPSLHTKPPALSFWGAHLSEWALQERCTKFPRVGSHSCSSSGDTQWGGGGGVERRGGGQGGGVVSRWAGLPRAEHVGQ